MLDIARCKVELEHWGWKIVKYLIPLALIPLKKVLLNLSWKLSTNMETIFASKIQIITKVFKEAKKDDITDKKCEVVSKLFSRNWAYG